MNDFSVKAIDQKILENLDVDQIIAFTYAEKDARRFSGMIDIAVYDGKNFTFYFDNYLDSSLTIKDYSKILLPLMRSARLEVHIKNVQKDYAIERNTSFDGIKYSLGAFSRNWMHYLIGEHRHLFINRKQDIYIEELAAAISENIAQTNIVPTIKTQLSFIEKYWPKAIADIFEIEIDKFSKPNTTEQRHLTAKKLQFIYASPESIKVVNESNKTYRAFEANEKQLNIDARQLLELQRVSEQSKLVGATNIELDYFFHSDHFYFIDNEWIRIDIDSTHYIIVRHEYFDQTMRLCGYYRRKNLYETIVNGAAIHDDGFRYLFDYYWRICALRLAPNSELITKPFQEHLDQLPLTQHAYNLLQLEATMNRKIDIHRIIGFMNLVNTYLEDIPDDKSAKKAYLRRDEILSSSLILSLPHYKYHETYEIYGQIVADTTKKIRKFKREKPEILSMSESLILTASIIYGLKNDFANIDIADFYRKSILKDYLEQIGFIISDRNKLPYTEEGEFSNRNALWFSQLKILQMRIDYLLDN